MSVIAAGNLMAANAGIGQQLQKQMEQQKLDLQQMMKDFNYSPQF